MIIEPSVHKRDTESRVRPRPAGDRLFLPNFCGIRMVFVVVVLAQLLSFVLVMTRYPGDLWAHLGLTSMFLQWIALTGAAALCVLRGQLARLTNAQAGIAGFLVLMLVTAMFSEAVYQMSQRGLVAWAPSQQSHAGYLLRHLVIGSIVFSLALHYFYVRDQLRRQMEAESEARLQALYSRIRPHFLFNSMNTIASLTRSDPRLAEDVVQDLADLFRVNLSDVKQDTTLARELEVARKYLHIESYRLGDRLEVSWDIEGLPEYALMPGLTLQPLLENAIGHGIEPAENGGSIEIIGNEDKGKVILMIRNSLPGPGDHAQRDGNRLALDNIRQRFAAFFEDRGKLFISQVDNSYQVRLVFPVLRERDQL